MKQSFLTTLLAGVWMLCAVLTIILAAQYYFSMKETERLRLRYAQISSARAAMQALAEDAINFSQQNPSIDPVLQEFKLKPKAGAAAPAAPAGKAPGK